MAAVLRSYMAEEVTAFKLDEELNETADATQDETVDEVRWILWCFYDDFDDHKVHASAERRCE